jgi:hypothetical protein
MAKWSAKVEQSKAEARAKREEDRVSNAVAARLSVFKALRLAGWKVKAVEPASPHGVWVFDNLPDDARQEVEFRVKMPGALEARIRTFSALLRIATGVGYAG